MNNIKLRKGDYIWNFLGYGANLGLNIFLLPLVLCYLQSQQLALWYVFMSIGAFASLLDFGFAPQMARYVSYIYSGANEIVADGVSRSTNEAIDYSLFGLIIQTSKRIYLIIAVCIFLLMITVGFWYIKHISEVNFDTSIAIAWCVYSVACFINTYFAFYNSIFRGIGNFVVLNKAMVLSKSVQLLLSFVGLYFGYGLVAVSFAYLVCGLVFRLYLVRQYNRMGIPKSAKYNSSEIRKAFKKIWHNAWRDGICMLARFFNTQANTILCSLFISLTATAHYSLSLQIGTIITTVSMIIFTTIQPRLNAETLNRNKEMQRQLFATAIIFYFTSFILLGCIVALFGNEILALLESKTDIHTPLFVLMLAYLFFEGFQSLCASYISSSNKLIYYKAFFISSLAGVLLSVALLLFTKLGIWSLVIAPMIVQACYNNWKWPVYVLRDLNVSIPKLLIIGAKSIKTVI